MICTHSNNTDTLSKMFELQTQFMKRLGHDPETMTAEQKTQHSMLMHNCINVECSEMLQELNWKPWKKTKKDVDEAKVREEIIDVFHFLLELMIIHGITATDLRYTYEAKMAINNKRQDNGY